MITELVLITIRFLSKLCRIVLLEKHKNIVIFRHDELGDWLLWLSAASEIRKFYSKDKCRIVLIGKPETASLSEVCPHWDAAYDFDIKKYLTSLLYRFKMIFKLSGADIVLNPVPARNITVDQLIRYSGAAKRVGIDVKPNQFLYRQQAERELGNSCYTKLLPLDLSKHILEINADFVEALTGSACPVTLDALNFIPTHKPDFENYVLIVPGAGFAKRCWEPEKFADVINRIIEQRPEIKIVISGTDTDLERSEIIIANVKNSEQVIDLCGKTDLPELCGIVKHSLLVIGNDSAPIHLAANYQVPSLCVLGGGHFGSFHPYPEAIPFAPWPIYSSMPCFSCNWHCYENPYDAKPFPCISAISVDSVWDKIQHLLIKNNEDVAPD